ncbi:MAG: NADH-quinone oxidoreductase subunit C [Armatimonadetes bacterium]|nr:NADH-quinone oxidoreductase subunit C [Armatimonadota bacterium]
MTGQEIVERLRERIGEAIVDSEIPKPSRLYVNVRREALARAAEVLFGDLGARYVVGGGTDLREHNDTFLVTHFFAFDKDGIYMALHTEVPPDDPTVPSITPVIPGANWAEREIYDTIGVRAEGHPDPRRLVLPEDWPEGVFPLRSDYPHDYTPPPVETPATQFREPPANASVVPIGPFYPVLEEPAHFRVFVDGERVVGCDYRGFYNHRGVEKLGCYKLTYNQIPFVAERICGICGFVHSTCYCQAVEEAAGIEIPPRAAWIRTIILELERIHSHLLWTGIAGHIIGFDTVLMQTWRMREPLMWLCEEITGNRKTYGMNIVGGVRRDISPEAQKETLKVLEDIQREWEALVDAIPGDTPLMRRVQGHCILTTEEARALCATGPTARGSNRDIDVRTDHPYAAYGHLKSTRKIVQPGCDILARVLVRLQEVFVSIDIVREAIATLPEGPLQAEITEDIPPWRQGMSGVEAPRGEVFHWVLTGGDNRPIRWRVRAPTYANLQNVPPMILGDTLADVPIGIGSFDPCFSCTERLEVVDVNSGRVRVYSHQELLEMQGSHANRPSPPEWLHNDDDHVH